MYKVVTTIANSHTKDKLRDVKYVQNEDAVEFLKDTVNKMVNSRMDSESDDYTPGVKWKAHFDVEEVTDSTVLESITLRDLKRLLLQK